MFLKIFFIVLFVFSGQNFCQAEVSNEQKPLIAAEISGGENIFYIGDKIQYQITINAKSNIDIQLPDISKKLGDFEIEDSGLTKRGFFGKQRIIQWYILANYEIGEFIIPPVVIKYKARNENQYQEAETNEVEVEIKSLLDKEQRIDDILDIKGPVSLPLSGWIYILLLLLLLLIVGLVIWKAVNLRKKTIKKEIVVIKPAHLIAHEALAALRQKDYVSLGRIKEYYEELSLIVRCYLENRFNFKAPEMTTEEFLSAAEDSDKLSNEHRKLLRGFLTHCDLVKFAKYGPSKDEMNASIESAEKLIDQTKDEQK